MQNGICCLCGVQGYCELHHTIFRSQAPYMKNIKINLVELCADHHRGNYSPHHNKKMDLKLKTQLQNELYKLFAYQDYFTEEDVEIILMCSKEEARNICKKLSLHIKGYEKEEIIKRLLGGRFY